MSAGVDSEEREEVDGGYPAAVIVGGSTFSHN